MSDESPPIFISSTPPPVREREEMVHNVVIHLVNGRFVVCGEGYAKDLNVTDNTAQVTCKECRKMM